MLLSRTQVLEMDANGLNDFMLSKHSEGHYLDYKVALSGHLEQDQKREFLKDVTGFANALGGHIVIGVKEPGENLAIDEQVVGILDGDKIAASLENVIRDSTQPRVPGFFIKSVKLATGKWVLIAHIPPSAVRPHMVDFRGHRTFYVRRHSSTEPMTVQELKDSILNSATAEGRAKEIIAARRADAIRYWQNAAPLMLLQAVPLVPVEELWAVEREPILSIVRGFDRIHRYHFHGVATEYSPRITIDGVIATNNPEEPYWVWELHRSGYLSILIRLKPTQISKERPPVVLIHKGFHDPFFVMAEILQKCWETTGFDAPYAMSAELFPTGGSVFKQSSSYNEYSKPYYRDEIVWPTYIRNPGQEPQAIAQLQIADMYRAYGLMPPTTITPTSNH